MFSFTTVRPALSFGLSLKKISQTLLHSCFSQIKISNRETAIQICQLIPAQCPFEREIRFFGYTLFHLPPLCKLNPAYDELVALRFQALSFLADQCKEDVSQYCS